MRGIFLFAVVLVLSSQASADEYQKFIRDVPRSPVAAGGY
jgi:hypothetical protein